MAAPACHLSCRCPWGGSNPVLHRGRRCLLVPPACSLGRAVAALGGHAPHRISAKPAQRTRTRTLRVDTK